MDYPSDGFYISYCRLKNLKTVQSNVRSGRTGLEHLTGQKVNLDNFPTLYKGEGRRFSKQVKYCQFLVISLLLLVLIMSMFLAVLDSFTYILYYFVENIFISVLFE